MIKTYTMGLYEKALPNELDWREKLLAAKEAGYDFLEISIDETDYRLERLDMSKQERYKLLNLSQEIGMPIRTMCLSGHRKYPFGSNSEEIRKKSMEIMKKAIDFADDLGIRIIQLAGYDVYYEMGSDKTKKFFVENLKKAVNLAASKGILLGFETMETEFMNTTKKAMNYVDKIDSKYLGVYPDIGNITNAMKTYDGDVLEDLETGRGHLIAMHLKETVPGKFREIPFGTGHVDFEAGIEKVWSLGVRRFVTEMWYTGNPEWKDDLAFAIGKMRTIIEKIEGDCYESK